MTALRPLIFMSALGLCPLLLATERIKQMAVIYIEPGEYEPLEIIDFIQAKGIFISYSQASINKTKISITEYENSLNMLLDKLFDPANYTHLIKGNKVLIVKKQNGGPDNSSGTIYLVPDPNNFYLASFNFPIPKLKNS